MIGQKTFKILFRILASVVEIQNKNPSKQTDSIVISQKKSSQVTYAVLI